MTPEELAKLIRFLRIDEVDEETEQDLTDLYKRAQISVKNQARRDIDLNNPEMKEQYDQACALLVQHWYDNRESFRIGNASYEIPHSLDSILRELRYCYPAGDSNETN